MIVHICVATKPSVQFSSVTQSCPTLCDPMNCSTPGLPVHHQLPKFTQTHGHQVSDAIQPTHLLSSPSPPAPNPSQHQSLFQWVSSLHQVTKVLELQLQHQSFQWICRIDFFRIDWFDRLAVQGTLKSLLQHFESINSSALSLLYGPILTSVRDYWKNHSFNYTNLCQQRSVYWSRLWFFQWSCMDVRVGLWRKFSAEELMLLKCGVGEDS